MDRRRTEEERKRSVISVLVRRRKKVWKSEIAVTGAELSRRREIVIAIVNRRRGHRSEDEREIEGIKKPNEV